MRTRDGYEGGPVKAIAEFLASHPGESEIDRQMCDFYGTNTTWALDGYIKLLTSRSERTQPIASRPLT